MIPELFKQVINIGDGTEPISIETGQLAKQADGSIILRQGNTMIMATVVSSQGAREGVDFLPMSIEYKEKFASTGKFPGGFIKREMRPSENEILVCRIVDRALRPLFPSDYHAEIQVIINLISADKDSMPDALACLAASAAITLSDIPFAGPVSEVRVARVNGEWLVNPGKSQLEGSDLDLIVAGSNDSIVMVEGEMSEVSEADMLEGIKKAHEVIKVHCKAQLDLSEAFGKKETREYSHETHDEDLREAVKKATFDECYEFAKQGLADKHKRGEGFRAIRDKYMETFSEEELAEKAGLIKVYFHDVEKDAMRKMILEDGIRLDGRAMDEIRPIWSQVDFLPGAHGSAVFTRGETQSLTSLTLGSKLDEQSVDSATYQGSENFMLHYNFPPFSTGEARPMRGTSRREVGHGNLALRALKPVLPSKEENPYTIRLVSDILESNGSSSMATVCAGTLALMDGGIKIKAPVSGIAMGLITDGTNFKVLSDILGDEDHLGDMDFKVTGTEKGITACQMDIKVDGLPYEVLTQALEQARQGRLHILGEIKKTMDTPADDYKEHAPRIIMMEIPKESIGPVIGPGGKIIQEIQAETETTISIEEKDGSGWVQIMANNKTNLEAAKLKVTNIALPQQVEVDTIYEGKVKSIMPYGCFVEILPGTDGLLHVSELEHHRVNDVNEVVKEGDIVKFKVVGKDPRSGKYKLSRKVLLPKPESKEA